MTEPSASGGPDKNLEAALAGTDPGLANALGQISAALDGSAPTDLSEPALAKVLDLHAEYLEDLVVGAAGEARRGRADTISTSNVEVADAMLRVPRLSARDRVLTTVGGLLAGAGLSEFLAVIGDAHPSTLGYAGAFVSTVVGSVLISASWRN
jgi:hypothetical protein